MKAKSEYPTRHADQHSHAGSDETRIDWEDVGSAPGIGGGTILLYDYTVEGSPQGSIDTFIDGPYAGLLRTDLTYLEVYLTGRSSEAGRATADNNIFFNNDVLTGNYTRGYLSSTVSGHPAQAQVASGITFGGVTTGADAEAFVPGMMRLFIPNYASEYFFKICEFTNWAIDDFLSLTHYQVTLTGALWQNTDPITRIMMRPVITGTTTPGPDWEVGTRLSIWAR